MNKPRTLVAGLVFAVLAFIMLYSLSSVAVNPGVNAIYIKDGMRMAPNLVTLIVFDWRGYDTLGECLVLVSGVLAVSMLYGRGILKKLDEKVRPQNPDLKPTIVLNYVTPYVVMFTTAYGIYITLGGHITPGGGFQGGSIIAAGGLISLVVYGRGRLHHLTHEFLISLESVGLFIYMLLGLAGLFFGGFFLYNLGTNAYGIVPGWVATLFNYPDTLHAGILPYLNIAVMLKVSAGMFTILLVLLEVHE